MAIKLKFCIVFICCSFWLNAQKTIQPRGLEYEYKGIVYNKERAYHAMLHTNGFRAGVDFGKLLTYYKTKYYHISLGYISDPLEKSENKNTFFDNLGASKPFKFGKQNNFYQIRGGIGVKRYKSEKAKRRGVAVGWSYEVGPAIGILKPVRNYYLVQNSSGLKSEVEITYDDDPELFMNYSAIFGRSGSFDSWAQLKFRPGIQAQIAAHFAFGAFEEYVKAFEIGITADYYGVKVPILVESELHSNDALFINLFFSAHFGRRK